MTEKEKIIANALAEANGDATVALQLVVDLGRELLKTPEQRRREALYIAWYRSQRKDYGGSRREIEPLDAFLAGYDVAVAEITLPLGG